MADGVTVSSRSDLFADSLVRYFVQGEFYLEKPEERKKWWEICSREWNVQTIRLYKKMSAEGQQQHALGSAATFIGFWIDPEQGASLYSVGDCYGLLFSGSKFKGAFPKDLKFNNSPTTLDTRQELSAEKLSTTKFEVIEDNLGSMLVLCSDALAEYFLTQKPWEQKPDFWQEIEAKNDQGFGEWAHARYVNGELKDDDYTLLMLQFPRWTLSERSSTEGKAAAVQPVTALASEDQKSEQPFLGKPLADRSNEVEGKVEGNTKLLDDGHRDPVKRGYDVVAQAVVYQQ